MKIIMHLETGFCGMDQHEFWQVPDDISEDELNKLAWHQALDNAESYGIYSLEDFDENDSSLDEADYSENIEGYWELYCPEKHDQYMVGNEIFWNEY